MHYVIIFFSEAIGHMTKMAVTPFFVVSLLRNQEGKWHWVLVCSNADLDSTKFTQMMIVPMLTLTYFKTRSSLIPDAFI